MWRYTLRRLSFLPIILLAVSIFTFVLLRVLPTEDIADVIGGQNATAEQKTQIRARYHLNDPIFPISFGGDAPFVELHKDTQYSRWLLDALRGDFGKTYLSEKSVRSEFIRRFPASFEVVFLSLVVSVVFGLGFGILSAMYRNSLLDYFVRTFAVAGTSIPEFFLLTLLIIIPSKLWSYAPPTGGYVSPLEDPLTNMRLFLPASLILGIAGASPLMRLVRTTMLEVLAERLRAHSPRQGPPPAHRHPHPRHAQRRYADHDGDRHGVHRRLRRLGRRRAHPQHRR